MNENYIFTGEPETKTYNLDELELCFGKPEEEDPILNEIKIIREKVTTINNGNVRLVEAVDNLVFAINNLAVIAKEKGNKFGY